MTRGRGKDHATSFFFTKVKIVCPFMMIIGKYRGILSIQNRTVGNISSTVPIRIQKYQYYGTKYQINSPNIYIFILFYCKKEMAYTPFHIVLDVMGPLISVVRWVSSLIKG